MKNITRKQREWDVRLALKHRQGKYREKGNPNFKKTQAPSAAEKWLLAKEKEGYRFDINGLRKRIRIVLPSKLNFSDQYEATVVYATAIRILTETKARAKRAYRLSSVNFDNLRDISTSAALVLTAEISKWDDSVRQRLKPETDNWDPNILSKFKDLGFFDLFQNHSVTSQQTSNNEKGNVRVVRYIKANCGSSEDARRLKNEVTEIVGKDIGKWTFLHSGLTEAITNVTHHAYPEDMAVRSEDRNWYLGGGYDTKTRELKVVFFDQGIGIPRSLPASKVWERILDAISALPVADRKRDEVMLKAAMELTRTSTNDLDRGRGLGDLLEFIKQRREGYLSVLSRKGMYRFDCNQNQESVRSERFRHPLLGTLIIWKVSLGHHP